jgi:muramidase (phage lysozyme)
MMRAISAQQAGGQNRVAFLEMITSSEIGPALMGESDRGYNVLVGSTPAEPHLFGTYSQHPNVFDPLLNSTAAGAYQILYRWWVPYQQSLDLPDFSPLSQDLYALQQLREHHALPLIDAGQFAEAVAAVNTIWASLTGSPYGQHTNPIELLQGYYTAAGGVVA